MPFTKAAVLFTLGSPLPSPLSLAPSEPRIPARLLISTSTLATMAQAKPLKGKDAGDPRISSKPGTCLFLNAVNKWLIHDRCGNQGEVTWLQLGPPKMSPSIIRDPEHCVWCPAACRGVAVSVVCQGTKGKEGVTREHWETDIVGRRLGLQLQRGHSVEARPCLRGHRTWLSSIIFYNLSGIMQ